MATKERSAARKPDRILSDRTITVSGILLLLIAVGAVWLLLHFYGSGSESDKDRLDVIRTAGTIVVGTGGVAALWLTARRQRFTELELQHKKEAVDAANLDAIERRISEQYTRAADQLGSDKAPVRLAGVYSLERLAQENVQLREMVVNLYCAYLRMPFRPGDRDRSTENLDADARADFENELQEREVRLAVHTTLTGHLRYPRRLPHAPSTFWGTFRIDLRGAHLEGFVNFRDCRMTTGLFNNVAFEKHVSFEGCTVDFFMCVDSAANNLVEFTRCHFTDKATFYGTRFNRVNFQDALFNGAATPNFREMKAAKLYMESAKIICPSEEVSKQRLIDTKIPRGYGLIKREGNVLEFLRVES